MPKKTEAQRALILKYMSSGEWLSANDINAIVDVGIRRLRVLLQGLTADGLIEAEGRTKGKKYRIAADIRKRN